MTRLIESATAQYPYGVNQEEWCMQLLDILPTVMTLCQRRGRATYQAEALAS
jgi:hypothetical protein